MTLTATAHTRLNHGAAVADCPTCGCHSVIEESRWLGGFGWGWQQHCVCSWDNAATGQIDACQYALPWTRTQRAVIAAVAA